MARLAMRLRDFMRDQAGMLVNPSLISPNPFIVPCVFFGRRARRQFVAYPQGER